MDAEEHEDIVRAEEEDAVLAEMPGWVGGGGKEGYT